ncbi:hypothetical protein L916_09740 [Phytophthora nicotianae]|uniref:Uncharacterized protein n=1 Tax=Phytophthora nicotianae TaxID=4792 RepID=W2IZD8_PHYNI|nr:hypothetical protein L916_09740 [Phytophthora nicotianae]
MDYYRAESESVEEREPEEDIILRTRAAASTPWEPYVSDAADTDSDSDVNDDYIDDHTDLYVEQMVSEVLNPSPIDAAPNLRSTIENVFRQYVQTPPSFSPSFTNLEQYIQTVEPHRICEISTGTTDFIKAFQKLEHDLRNLKNASNPYLGIYEDNIIDLPTNLRSFPSIRAVSKAFKLNFWQHAMFEPLQDIYYFLTSRISKRFYKSIRSQAIFQDSLMK